MQFISIEGNIGSGKSTILKILKENFPKLTILEEPLDEWQKVGEDKSIDLLQTYYSDPARWGFTFQIYAFTTRLAKWSAYGKTKARGLGISQRSLISDKRIFAAIMRDSNILNEAQHEIYLQAYDCLSELNSVPKLSGVIYIRSEPETCQKRIINRCREGQEAIPIDYLRKIHSKHEEWLLENPQNTNTLVIENSLPLDKQAVIDQIGAWLGKMETASAAPSA